MLTGGRLLERMGSKIRRVPPHSHHLQTTTKGPFPVSCGKLEGWGRSLKQPGREEGQSQSGQQHQSHQRSASSPGLPTETLKFVQLWNERTGFSLRGL